MTVDDDCPAGAPTGRIASPTEGVDSLGPAVASLYSDLRLTPTLHTQLAHSRRLVDGVAGSISVTDTRAGTYSKVAERGISCRLGDTFSLAEGATGHAVARRRPVVIDDYSALTSRHLPPDHPANRGSVVAVPIWWRGDVIGVNVAFAGRRRRFSAAEIDRLDVLTQSAAGAIVTAGAGEPSLARLLHDRVRHPDGSAAATTPTEVGDVRPAPAVGAQAAVDLVTAAQRAKAGGEPPSRLHVAIVHRARALRLLIQEEHAGGRAGGAERLSADDRRALLALAGVAAHLDDVPGWGTLLRADLPYDHSSPAPAERESPLTAREAEVLALAARGLGNREIARRLVLSPKTIEKHVGSAIRKTGTASRTAAAEHALEHGWT